MVTLAQQHEALGCYRGEICREGCFRMTLRRDGPQCPSAGPAPSGAPPHRRSGQDAPLPDDIAAELQECRQANTAHTVIAAMGISRSTWQKLVRQGATPPIVKLGAVQRVRRDAFDAWVSQHETPCS
jgi:predicted DNA-binding transcriptional regulator AlpA